MFTHLSAAAARRRSGRLGIVLPGGYAALVIAVTLVVAAVGLFSDDPGFVGIWLALVSAPLSIPALWLTDLLGEVSQPVDQALFFLSTTGAGLAQAWLLRLLVRGRRTDG
ncbi:hypothetical protein AGRA3207_005414 [Actinomadura graeca]|uniref:Uncharacterized protein n=1 Tax=Actinomadura graeca TaxID=2750812 RepID=A0ABX8QZD1_9ACTN|nr:hypothetical protein [Actinomadura graeca]QXJ24150.1 hypothetical protein AGRA3207_005414 [Actinomadura graeca]